MITFFNSNYISNYEPSEYKIATLPTITVNNIALYDRGIGNTVLLFPYPHAHTEKPMAYDHLSEIFLSLGYRVITFDPPGAFFSTKSPDGTMEEILNCAQLTVEKFVQNEKLIVAGHSMGSLCAQAYTLKYPELIKKLIIVGGIHGFSQAVKYGLPASKWNIISLEYWYIILRGLLLTYGFGNLEKHKNYENFMLKASFFNKSFIKFNHISKGDRNNGVPIRSIWSKNLFRRENYSDLIHNIKVPTLICVGKYDCETPLKCSLEIKNKIKNSKLVVFQNSGHSPFIEEREKFSLEINNFLNAQGPWSWLG